MVVIVILSVLLHEASAQKGGAKGAMRGRGKGGKGRGGGSRAGGYNTGDMDTMDSFGGGYSGKNRPCVGLCYLRYLVKSQSKYKLLSPRLN